MAQGEICPKCQYYMFALEEKEDIDGVWVFYECRNEQCKHRMKVLEDKVTLFTLCEMSHNSLEI